MIEFGLFGWFALITKRRLPRNSRIYDVSAHVTRETETDKYVPAALQEYFWADEQLMARKEKER